MFFLPQMSPMWWLSMMLFINTTLIMMNSMLYFNKLNNLALKNKQQKNMNWMW